MILLLDELVTALTPLKTSRGIKAIYKGDTNITDMDVPCIILSPATSRVETLDSAEDTIRHPVDVRLVVDQRAVVQGTAGQNAGQWEAMKIMMEQNATTGALLTTTILSAVRRTLETSKWVHSTESISINWKPVDFRDRTAWSGEYILTFVALLSYLR